MEHTANKNPAAHTQGRYHTILPSMQEFFHSAKEQLEQEWTSCHMLKSCPVFFNITNFHLYNAAYGIESGDQCLRQIAALLQKYFPDRLITHLGADHFAVLADAADVKIRVEAVCHEARFLLTSPNIELKAGIRYLTKLSPDTSVHFLFDNDAALACHSVKQDATRHFAVYTEEMGRLHRLRNYVLENFETALQNEYIKIYYQPVIRSLNGKICGAEALARWEAPEHGLLSPDIFIPVLEEANLIHQLDLYMVRGVAKRLRFLMDQDTPVCPVSVNLSRLDFQLTDLASDIESILKRYGLPRCLIHLEITENALTAQNQSIKKGIREFQLMQYQVWLDDFGSGYSSLNVLKDFHFHTLKLDMAFLRPFTKKSRTILTAIIRMAKELGIHTLAEGVETKEQADFLRGIGCEKMQGYYFGRPLPEEESHERCHDQSLKIETEEEDTLFSQAGLIDISRALPVAIVYDDNENIRILQCNSAYLKTLNSIGTKNLSDSNYFLSAPDFPMRHKFRRFINKAKQSGQSESMTYVDNGQYLRVNLKTIAQVGQKAIHRAELYNISIDEAVKDRESRRFDQIVRNIILTFEGLWYLDMQYDTLDIIESVSPQYKAGMSIPHIDEALSVFASRYIHPSDRQRFQELFKKDNFYEAASDSHCSEVSAPFRMLRTNGSFDWLFFTGIVMVKSPAKDVLIYLTKNPLDHLPDRQQLILEMLKSYGMEQNLFTPPDSGLQHVFWQTFLHHTKSKFFWKDRQHRFLGASRAYLNWLGLADEACIIGKTAQEVGISLDVKGRLQKEENVMYTGKAIEHAAETVIFQQKLYYVYASKYPIYQREKIIGIMVFLEETKCLKRKDEHLPKSAAAAPSIHFPYELFENTADGIVITDLETYDVLYCNPAMRRSLHLAPDAPCKGEKCYALMAGLTAPCEDCVRPQLSYGHAHKRVFHNPIAGLDFLLQDTIISYQGRNCQFTRILNLADYIHRDTHVKETLFREASINDAIRLGMYELNPEDGIKRILARIGQQLHAERMLIIEEQDSNVQVTYHWTGDKAKDLPSDFPAIPRTELWPLFNLFAQKQTISLPDLDAFWNIHPDYAPHLPGIRQLVASRLILDGQPLGFVEAVNPAPEHIHDAALLLSTLTRFLAILLRNRDMMKRLEHLSKVDQLTGIMNRRGLLDRISALPADRCYAFFFGDLNGLKETNDTQGHEAGDRLIQSAAAVFVHVGGENNVFRMGGDEFLMLYEARDEQSAKAIEQKLNEHFAAAKISIALGWTLATTPIDNIDPVLARADSLMYQQKILHHRTRHKHS